MKINDKHLAAFAMSDSPVDKAGFLQKRGEVNKAYQRRYFILKGNLLFYFEKQSDREPTGVIVLEECTVEVAEGNTDGHTFELVFPGVGSRHYVLSADSQENMESWMRAITCANYEYTKLLVSELQRQLDELNLEQAASHSSASSAQSSGSSHSVQPAAHSVKRQNAVAKTRQNPFNMSQEPEITMDPSTAEPQRVRTFEELHFEFGKYITEKVEECAKNKAE